MQAEQDSAMEKLSIIDHSERFVEAILNGDRVRVSKLLLQRNINVNKPVNNIGDTVLHLAIQSEISPTNKIIAILDIFIDRGVDPNTKNNKQETPLHLAIAKWNKQIIEYLLQRDAKIDVIDDQGYSIVHYFVKKTLARFTSDPHVVQATTITIERKCADFVEWLLERGFDFDRKSKNGRSPLHLAVEYNLQPILPILLKHTNDVNFVSACDQQTLLQLFLKASNNDPNQATRYFGFGINSAETEGYEFSGKFKVQSSVFSRQYDIEIVRILLERGVSPEHVDKQGQTAFQQAVDAGRDMEIIKLLFSPRFTRFQNRYGFWMVCTAVKHPHSDYYFEILTTMTDKGVDLNSKDKNGQTPLYLAVKHKNLRAIGLMKENGVDFHLNTDDGNNLLHALAESKSNDNQTIGDRYVEQTFDLLVGKGCQVNLQNSRGETPLHLAIENNNFDVIKKLVEHGADVNCREQVKDWTPLHLAAASRKSSIRVIKLLLDNGAKVNCKSRYHGRPLHLVANFDRISMGDDEEVENVLAMLLSRDADVNARDPQGNSALVRAILVNSVVNVYELLAFGADISDDCVIRALKYNNGCDAGKRVLQHCFKLKVAKLPCSKQYQAFLTQEEHQILYRECLREIDKLKGYYIDSHTSLYRWLHMYPNQRYLHIYSDKLLELIGSSTFSKQFPQYSNVILGCYRETATRKALLKAGKKAWLKLTEIDLLDICLEHIFAHLNTGYLYEFIEQADEYNDESSRQQ